MNSKLSAIYEGLYNNSESVAYLLRWRNSFTTNYEFIALDIKHVPKLAMKIVSEKMHPDKIISVEFPSEDIVHVTCDMLGDGSDIQVFKFYLVKAKVID